MGNKNHPQRFNIVLLKLIRFRSSSKSRFDSNSLKWATKGSLLTLKSKLEMIIKCHRSHDINLPGAKFLYCE